MDYSLVPHGHRIKPSLREREISSLVAVRQVCQPAWRSPRCISTFLSLHLSISISHMQPYYLDFAMCLSFKMKLFMFHAILVSITGIVVALPASHGYVPPGAQCQDYSIPVTVTSLNYPWTAAKWTDNYGLIDFVSVASSRTDAGFPPPIGKPVNQTATYIIGATFCTPVNPTGNSGKVLLATHGLAFDRR